MKIIELLKEIDNTHKDFNTSKPYVCGGIVRDKFMNRLDNISDLDLTTGDVSIHLLAQEFLNKVKKTHNIVSKVGADGHLSVSFGNFKLDFSSNFVLPNIESIVGKKLTNIEKETYSRDFTCNAMISDLYFKNIYDITNKSKQDINNKIIDTVLDPAIVFNNSKNRPIRAIYLAIKLDFNLSDRVLNYLTKYPFLIKDSKISTIKEKLDYCFNKDKDRTIYLLNKTNMIKFMPYSIDE